MRKSTLRTLAGLCALVFIVSGLLAFTPLYSHEEESSFRDSEGRLVPLRTNRLTGERFYLREDSAWVPAGIGCGNGLIDLGYYGFDKDGRLVPRKPF